MPRHAPLFAAFVLTLPLLAVGCGGAGDSASPPTGEPPAPETPDAASGPAAVGGTATITGVIRYEGKVPKLRPVSMGADPACAQKHGEPVPGEALVVGEGNVLVNAFVEITGGLPEGTWPVPSGPVVLDQQGCRYVPHVIGVMAGQTLKVLNSDGLLHNVNARAKENRAFNRSMPANVKEIEHTFTEPEAAFKMKCDVHPWMGAWVTVTDHPFFAVSGDDGTFAISGLPAGELTVTVTHDGLGTMTETATLEDGGQASVELAMSRE